MDCCAQDHEPAFLLGAGASTIDSSEDEKSAKRSVFISFNYDDILQQQLGRVWLRQRTIRKLPTFFAISILLLPRKDRDEVLADLQEWYDELAENHGASWARLFVVGKLLSSISGQVLTVAERLAGIVGKIWGRQKG